jgi:two-component system chemotaxis response regulator CheY
MAQDTNTQGSRLLIVDDSKVSRIRIRAFFTAHCPSWDIQEVGTGDEAIAINREWAPDFVTMDVNMPGMSGFEAAPQIMALNPKVRVIMLTANIQESSKQMAASLKLNFVAKPATEASLQQALDYMLGGA